MNGAGSSWPASMGAGSDAPGPSLTSSAFVRRRPGGASWALQGEPLHPPNRPRPSSSSYLSSSATSSNGVGGGDLMDDGYAAATPSRKRPQRGDSGTFGRSFGGAYDYDDHREPHFLDEASRNASHSSFYTAPSSSTTLLAQGHLESSWDRRQSATSALHDVASASSADAPPARKRRKGVAGTILDGALNGLMYGGAAAMTAYSLWSSWKKDPAGEGDGNARRRKQQQDQEEEEALAREWGPARGGKTHHPPPAYDEVVLPGGYPASAAHAAAQQTPKSSASASPFVSKPRSRRNVYLSSSRHRRRPLFESARASSSRSLAAQQVEDGAAASRQQDEDDGMDNDDNGDEDEQYSRFSRQMADLIAQGEAALRSKADVDLEFADAADDYSAAAVTASPSTTSNLALPSTPSRIPTYAGRAMTSSRSTAAVSSPAAHWRGVGETNLRFGGHTSNSPTPTSTPRRKSTMATGGRTSSPAPALPSSPSSTPFVFGGSGGSSSPFRKAAGLSRSRQHDAGSEGEGPVRRAW